MTEPTGRLTAALRDTTFRWIADDADPRSRAELQDVLARAMGGDATAVADLEDRMAGPLTFGTAGLRGPVRAGPNGMNTAVVVRTTAAVASWLASQDAAGGIVVIGRDARRGSETFAAAAAEVLAAAGFAVRTLPAPLPTPVLAFAVRQLGAVAGIQITASHNPPADNGYKLYDGTGAQIVPPADRQIEAAIASAPAAVSVPRDTAGVAVLGDDVLEAYLARVHALPRGGERTLRVAATALHGVGAEVLRRALQGAGFTDVHLVAEQSQPDATFPTVSFPNPEVPGATDLLYALAAEVDADLVVALDPDADRCQVGTRSRDGSWRPLTGDQAGVVLGDHVLSTADVPDPLVATTVVSSSMLRRVAAARGARYAETLTGFKWLARAGDGLVFAYEEALGLCVDPGSVRDKDGIAAAVLACDLAATLKARGRTLFDAYDDLTVRHGLHRTGQVTIRMADPRERAALMARVRAEPPASLGGVELTAEDLLPDADVLLLRGEGVRVALRPSGTEPTLKAYLEVTAPAPPRERLAEADAAAGDRLQALATDVDRLLTP
ncbi:phospho-sugar mutase [Prauserella muralis]|uniref:Phosphomannomutase n=1 Tax=Prauserella muralis TaxID=588067 RepID=A0A2V4BB00_9PSEU|nr:phospho-sugar mutase [Prauserella muralis]PXY32326.1 phosphomannomutase [Prauserella muralis]TWE23995.1 phosphomannomutase [Prauserella muralis]